MSTGRRCGLAILSGVLDALGFVGFGFFPLTWIAKVPVLLAVRDSTPKRAFWLGLLYGVVAHLGGYYWLGETLVKFSGLSEVVSLALLILVSACFALLFAALMGCVAYARRTLGLAPVWTLMVVYPTLEFVFPNFLPYNIGASQYRFTAITQIVELTGLLGLTALIGMINGAVYEWVEARYERRKRITLRWVVPTATFVLVLACGVIRIQQVDGKVDTARHLTVGLIQSNAAAEDKARRRNEIVERHREMTRALIEAHPEIDLVVWPESVIFSETRDLAALHHTLDPQRPMVVGAFLRDGEKRLFNAMLATSANGELVGRFDKRHLIPFSETMPMVETFPFLGRYHPRGKMIERGTKLVNLRVAGVTALPMICYEDIIPAFVREMWHRAGPSGVLLNVSNDSWFGDSHEPLVHLALASFRSIETRRALIRSTETGISAFVDPVGRIVSRTAQWRSDVLVADIPVIEDGSTTPYLRYGDLFGWACLSLTAAGLFATLRVNRRGRIE